MKLRPYQREWVDAVIAALPTHNTVLAPAATGAGKTIMAAELCRHYARDKILFLADARNLVFQAAEKIGSYCGEFVGIEMGNQIAQNDRVICATTQSIEKRLKSYSPYYFQKIIIDEAHRNTLGKQALSVLNYFEHAKKIGITATPFRADKKQLSEFYEKITETDCGLIRLINEGYLSRITIKSVPVAVDMQNVPTVAGDYKLDEIETRIAPHISALARGLRDHAPGRKTVAFLPSIATSQEFTTACRSIGLRAVHVDGIDSSQLKTDWDVVSNASLLTTGWDCPAIDCVYICRPTKSLVLYSQMVGRGTRTHIGKSDMLLLDPIFLSEKMDIMRPHRLIAKTTEESEDMQDVETGDLLVECARAHSTKKKGREDKLAQKMAEIASKKARCIDAIEFYLSINRPDLCEEENEYAWQDEMITPAQAEMLVKNGFDIDNIPNKGAASRLIDTLMTRRKLGLASPKQVRLLRRLKHPFPDSVRFDEASDYIDKKLDEKKPAFMRRKEEPPAPPPTASSFEYAEGEEPF